MKVLSRGPVTALIVILSTVLVQCSDTDSGVASKERAVFSFVVTSDMRQFAGPQYQNAKYFMGACEAIKEIGKGAFMVGVGDIDPPWHTYNTIKKVLGEDYLWYPVVGNHDAQTHEDMEWLRAWGRKDIPNLVRKGPEKGEETSYSFAVRHAHFVVINQYYDGKSDTGPDADISDALYTWLEKDLEENAKPFIFVFGHKPIVSIPDYHNGRHRHKGDNLDAYPKNSHRFQQLLRKHGVRAYICGHTHNCSFAKINGLWQLDAGHSRGIGDTGARSTFLKISVGTNSSWAEFYRDDGKGGTYALTNTVVLK